MDVYEAIHEKAKLIAKGLQCIDNIQGANELIVMLDDFAERQMYEIEQAQASIEAQKNEGRD